MSLVLLNCDQFLSKSYDAVEHDHFSYINSAKKLLICFKHLVCIKLFSTFKSISKCFPFVHINYCYTSCQIISLVFLYKPFPICSSLCSFNLGRLGEKTAIKRFIDIHRFKSSLALGPQLRTSSCELR